MSEMKEEFGSWKNFKAIVLEIRAISNGIKQKHKLWNPPCCEFIVNFDSNTVFELNAFSINLKTGEYRSVARNSINGRYQNVPNLQLEFNKK